MRLSLRTSLHTHLAGAAGAVVLLAAAWALRAYTPDDAFISFSYAQRHAAGDGWVASAGTPPVEGFSNPLWVFVLEVAARLQLDLVRTAKVLGFVFGAALVWTAAALAEAVAPERRWAPWGAALLVATWPPLALWTASGMENAFYGFLLAAGTLGAVREVAEERPTARSAGWWVAAMWTRPEAFGLAAVAGAWRLTRWNADRRRAVQWVAIAVLGLAALVAWRYATFGEWLPNTYYAKRNNLLIGKGPDYLLQGAWQAGFGAVAALAVIAPLLRARHTSSPLWRDPAAFLLALAAAQAVFVLVVGGDWMHQFRFLTPLAPWTAVLAVAAAAAMPRRPLAVGALVAAAWCASVPSAWRGARTNRSVDIVHESWAPYRNWLHTMARALGLGAGVVIPELGYPSYATDLRVLDPLGLASTHVAHVRFERVDRLLRLVWRPDAIKVHSYVREALRLDGNRWFRDGYVLLAGPEGAHARREAVDGWYVRRDLFERAPRELPPPVAEYAGKLQLRAVRIEPPAARPGDTVRVHLTWFPVAALDDWRYDVRIRTPGGENRRLRPAPLHGWRQTSQWLVGLVTEDRVDIELDETVAVGAYDIAVGFRRIADDAPVAAVPIGGFEVVNSLTEARVNELVAQANAHMDAKDAEAAWITLAPVRAAGIKTPEATATIERVGGLLASRALAEAWERVQAGDMGGARGAVDRARELKLAAWPVMRDGFVARLHGVARPAEDVADEVPTWNHIRVAALALHAAPADREGERLVRELWQARVAWERVQRDLGSRSWRGEYEAATPTDSPPLRLEQDGRVLRLAPGLAADRIGRAVISYDADEAVGTGNASKLFLQLLLFDHAGHTVVILPIHDRPGPLVIRGTRDRRRIVIEVQQGENAAQSFPVGSLAPNPWGAPFYPPQPPVVLQAAVVRVDANGATPLPITNARLRVHTHADGSPTPPANPDWQLLGAPDVTAHRPYEVLPPARG